MLNGHFENMNQTSFLMQKTAIFSPDRLYRYELIRIWDVTKRIAIFICLNPSTADETVDDPTLTRCIGYAMDWGYGGVVMLNIFACRATKQNDMMRKEYPIGPRNDEILKRYLDMDFTLYLAGWGDGGRHLNRGVEVANIFKDKLRCLNVNESGHPTHPLYLKKDLKPIPYGVGA